MWIRILILLLLPSAAVAAEPDSHWAFRPVRSSPAPAFQHPSIQSPIDRFVFSRLAAAKLQPAPLADKRTLLRRATYDLTGLPPTPQEIDAFLHDNSLGAFAAVVDRLLASPAYGERFARHWLDVARYADSNGMDENLVQAQAWRYRDYVIRSFNADKPFDQFVREQIAGDLLPDADETVANERVTATAFLSLGPKMLAEDDPVKMEMDIVDEQLDTAGKAFLGLTLGCARCHDHKFDPLSMADYYGLAGIFKSTKTMNNFKVVAQWHERPVATKAERARFDAHQQEIADAKHKLNLRLRAAGERIFADWSFPRATSGELKKLQAELAELQKSAPVLPETMAVTEGTAADLKIHLRGNHLTQGAIVPRRFPIALAGAKQDPLDAKQSGRFQLAHWLTRADNPLTARVIVNRVWHWHFGTGIVRSTDNFGKLGDRPSHPELLDWLASQFVADGWSLKRLHRRIMLSATYQMSCSPNDAASAIDPDNRLRWRFDRRRLEAESLRDSLLSLGGNLERTMGGSLLEAKNRAYVPGYPNGVYEKYDFPRRSIYLPVLRSMMYDVFQAFDACDPSTTNGERASTTIAPQALFMLNGKLMHEQSRRFGERLLACANNDADRVRIAYECAYARPATSAEIDRALKFLQAMNNQFAAAKIDAVERQRRAWQSLARVILSANEFMFVE